MVQQFVFSIYTFRCVSIPAKNRYESTLGHQITGDSFWIVFLGIGVGPATYTVNTILQWMFKIFLSLLVIIRK